MEFKKVKWSKGYNEKRIYLVHYIFIELLLISPDELGFSFYHVFYFLISIPLSQLLRLWVNVSLIHFFFTFYRSQINESGFELYEWFCWICLIKVILYRWHQIPFPLITTPSCHREQLLIKEVIYSFTHISFGFWWLNKCEVLCERN